MKWDVPLFRIYWDEEDVNSTVAVIRSGSHWAVGESVTRFEKELAAFTGTKYAAAVNSGTSALHILLQAYGIGPGDEVIVPSFTFIATANAPLFVGAKPVFADIEEDTFGLNPADVSRRITPATKAILPIHFAGFPCRIKELRQLADEKGILLLEDAAEAMGASVGGRGVGTFGHASILSFCQNKIMTTGEGGAVATDSADIYEKCLLLRSHGRVETEDYFTSGKAAEYTHIGYNFRLSSISAALGSAQLGKIDKLISARRQNADYLTQKLAGISGLVVPSVPQNRFCVYQMYPVLVKAGREVRDGLKEHLAGRGIASKVYFDPVHLSGYYRQKFGFRGGELPVTEKVSGQILSLPMYPSLSESEMDYIAGEIKNYLEGKA